MTETGIVTNGGLFSVLGHCYTAYFMSSVRRTQVLDDESDYFATDSNQWLSPNEREKLRKKEEELRELRHASRKDRKITLDFAGRQVIDEGNNLDEYYKKWDEDTEKPALLALVKCCLITASVSQNGWNTEGYEPGIYVRITKTLRRTDEQITEG